METASLRIVLSSANPPQQLHTAPTGIRSIKFASSASRIFLQTVFCIASVVLGFRISQQTSLMILQLSRHSEHVQLNFDTAAATAKQSIGEHLDLNVASPDALVVQETIADDRRPPHPDTRLPAAPFAGNVSSPEITTGVQVGRHRILIREWPHPDPMEVMKAYNLIAEVQQKQALLYGVRDWKPIIAITPTFSRMFQALHLTGLMHTLSNVRGPVTWIVIEAGGVSNGTAELLTQARVHNVVHLGYPRPMPEAFEARWIMESHSRVEGLRFVREKQLEGVIVFADDSNSYSLKFFDLAQKVNWVGVVPMGILGYTGFQDASTNNQKRKRKRRGSLLLGVVHKGQVPPKIDLQVQTLAPDGWYAHRPLPLDWDSGKGTPLLDNKLQWAGFVMNARAVWADSKQAEQPHWLQDWKVWTRLKENVYLDIRSVFKDESYVEELVPDSGSNAVLHWWLRMEGRSNGNFPSRWALDSQPKIVLPASNTPWLEEGVSKSTSNSTSLFSLSQTQNISSTKESPVSKEKYPSQNG